MKIGIRSLTLALTVAALLTLSACGGDNRVTLLYSPVGGAGHCDATVGVAPITDARADKMLGHNETVDLRPEGRQVDQWVRDAVVWEFEARGCKAAPLDKMPAADFTIHGEVDKANLVIDGMDHTLDLVLSLRLLEGDRLVLKKTYTGRWEKKILVPSREKSQDMFNAALGELLSGAVDEFQAAMKP